MKNKMTAALLALFLGGLGIHRFYMGHNTPGIVYILLSCCFGIGSIIGLIDAIILFMDTEEKFQEKVEAKKFLLFG